MAPLLALMAQIQLNNGADTAIATFDPYLPSLLPSGISALARDALAHDPAIVGWPTGVLRSVLDVSQDGALVGRAVVETPLIEVINTLKYKPLGKTDELALCVAATAGMQCLPTLHHPDAWHLGLYSDTGSLLPVANALAGKTGYVVTPDYRGRKVVAA